VPGDEGGLRGQVAEAGRVEVVEVLQLVGPDRVLRPLGRLAAADTGDELRADLRGQDVQQRLRGLPVELVRRGHPADQVLDEGLGDAHVDVVVRHVVAHAVGAPPEGQLAEIARPQDDGVSQVGESKEVTRPLAGLDVLECDVVDLFALREGVPDVAEHLHAARADVDLVGLHAQGLHQAVGVPVRLVRRGKARHGVGFHAGPGPAQQVHRPGRHDERVGGVEAAGDADDDVPDPRGLQPRGQTLDLDVVGLVAALVALRGVGRHVGEAGIGPCQQDASLRGLHGEAHPAEPLDAVPQDPGVLAEARQAHPVLDEAVQVDVGEDHLRLAGKALRLAEQRAVLVSHGLAVPGQVRRRLPGPRRRVEVGRHAAGRLVGRQAVPVLRLADGDVRGREVGQDRGACQRRKARRRHGDPEVLADLDVEGKPRDVLRLEDQIRPEGDVPLAAEAHRLRQGVLGGAELAALVELAVVGQVGFQGRPQDPAPVHHDAAVEEERVDPQGRPHDEDRAETLRPLEEEAQGIPDPLQQGFLVKEVLVAVGREPEFREQGEEGLLCRGFLGQRDRLFRVERHVGDADLGDADGGPDEAVAVEVEKVLHGAFPPSACRRHR